jgi:hypothetical protein
MPLDGVWFVRFLMITASKWMLVLVCISACGTPARKAPASESTARSATTAKIASSIQSVLQRMRAEEVTAANVSARDASSYTNPLVRVDATGRIHTAVWVTHLQEQVLVELRRLQMHIEQTDTRQDVVQGWIPFHHIEQVAALSFVQYVRPPRYARGR